MRYELIHQATFALGGVALATALALMLVYRLNVGVDSLNSRGLAMSSRISLALAIFLYTAILLPWGWALGCCRGQATLSVEGAYGFCAMTLRGQSLVLLFMATVLWAQVCASRPLVSDRWVLEHLGGCLSLQLCWLMLQQCSSILSAILWLEIAGLSSLLLLTFVTLAQAERAPLFATWRAAYLTRQTQLGFLAALLSFLWAGGFAVIFLLVALSTGLALGGDIYLVTALLLKQQGLGPQAHAYVLLFGFLTTCGLMVKLMLQPFQAFLLAFYRRLPFQAVLQYLLTYYIFLLPALIFTFCGFLLTVTVGSFLSLLGVCGLLSLGFVAALGSSVDFRHTLAFSTIVNLSLLLLVVASAVM